MLAEFQQARRVCFLPNFGLLHVETKGTGTTYTTSTYTYRDDGRVSTIVHDTNDGTPQQLIYLYDNAGRVVQISDSGLDGSSYNTVYTYDDRNRLVSEVRSVDGTNATIYHINYSYDNGGNRKTKLTLVPASSTEATIYSDNYYYDTDTVDEAGNPLDAVAKYGSRNNRLMYYTSKKWDVVNGNPTLSSSETTWYYYNDYGHVERIVTRNSEENLYRGTRMEYDKMGRVWRVTNDQWVEDWRYFETDKTDWGRLQYWGVLAVDQAMSWGLGCRGTASC